MELLRLQKLNFKVKLHLSVSGTNSQFKTLWSLTQTTDNCTTRWRSGLCLHQLPTPLKVTRHGYCWEKEESPLELVTHQTGSGKEALVVLQLTFLTTFTNPLISSNPFNLREMKRQKAEQRVSSQITSFQSHGRLQDFKCWYFNYHIALQMLVAWPPV